MFLQAGSDGDANRRSSARASSPASTPTRCATSAAGRRRVAAGHAAGAEAARGEIGDAAFDSLEDALASGVDVVHVCTPNALHVEQTLLALEHGAHVVCEKPLAHDLGREPTHARGARVERPGRSRRLPRARLSARRAHARDRRGRGTSASSASCTGATSATTRSSSAAAGGSIPESSGPTYVTGDLGAHWFDLAEHVTGARIAEVLADFRTFVPVGALEDHASLLLRFDNGATGARELQRARPRPQEPAPVRARGQHAAASPGTRNLRTSSSTGMPSSRRRSSSRIPERTPGGPRVRALPGRARRGLRRCLPDDPARRVPRDGRPGARPVSDFRRRTPRHADPRSDIAQRRGRRLGLGGALGRGRPAARHEMQRAANESRAARTRVPSGTTKRRASAPPVRSPRA